MTALYPLSHRVFRHTWRYQPAGLLIMAGLVDSQTGKPVDDPAKLLGALASLHELSRDNPKWEEWKIKGQALLNQKKED